MSDYAYDYEAYFYNDYDERIHTSSQYLVLILSPILLLMGTVGNLLSVVVLYRLSREVASTCLYLALLAITDLLVLYTRCGNEWLMSLAQIDLSNAMLVSSGSVCKVYPFVFSFLFHMSRWLLASAAIEGAIATRWPQRALRLLTRSTAQAVVLLLTVLLVCLNIHYFWSFQLVKNPQELLSQGLTGKVCTFVRHGHHHSELFSVIIWPIIDTLVAEVIPGVVVTAAVIVMAIHISRGSYRGDEGHRAWRRRYEMDPMAADQLKLTLLVLCVCYLPAVLPKFFFNIAHYIFETSETSPNQTVIMLVSNVCSMLEFCYFALKFLVYVATSKKFRFELKKLVKCRCWRPRDKIRTQESLSGHPLMAGDASGSSQDTPRNTLLPDKSSPAKLGLTNNRRF